MHTGIIHRPNTSPGLIRMITVGYAISTVESSQDWEKKYTNLFNKLKGKKRKNEILKLKEICSRILREKAEHKRSEQGLPNNKQDIELNKLGDDMEKELQEIASATSKKIIEIWKEQAKNRVFKKKELIFATPLKTDKAVEAVQERFVVVDPGIKYIHYGDAVIFNLKNYKEPENQSGEEKEKEKKDLEDLKLSLPEYWKKKLNWIGTDEEIKSDPLFQGFKFKYFATEVKTVKELRAEEKFVLSPFFRFIKDFNEDTREDVLLKLAGIPHYGFKTTHPVGCNEGRYEISGVNLMDSSEFKMLGLSDPELCIDKAYKDEQGVQEEINDEGEHKISTVKELPTFEPE